MWEGIGDFLAMGGYAGYVWGSYGVAAAVLLLEGVLLTRRRRRARALLQRRTRRTAGSQPERGNAG